MPQILVSQQCPVYWSGLIMLKVCLLALKRKSLFFFHKATFLRGQMMQFSLQVQECVLSNCIRSSKNICSTGCEGKMEYNNWITVVMHDLKIWHFCKTLEERCGFNFPWNSSGNNQYLENWWCIAIGYEVQNQPNAVSNYRPLLILLFKKKNQYKMEKYPQLIWLSTKLFYIRLWRHSQWQKKNYGNLPNTYSQLRKGSNKINKKYLDIIGQHSSFKTFSSKDRGP